MGRTTGVEAIIWRNLFLAGWVFQLWKMLLMLCIVQGCSTEADVYSPKQIAVG